MKPTPFMRRCMSSEGCENMTLGTVMLCDEHYEKVYGAKPSELCGSCVSGFHHGHLHGPGCVCRDEAHIQQGAITKLDIEELPYEPACSVQRLDNWAAVDRRETLFLPAWIVEEAKEWAVITDCEGEFVALVSNEKADLIRRVLNEAGQ